MSNLTFWAVFIVLAAFVFYFDKRYYMLRCNSLAALRPYSFARVQLAWWMVIVLASFISIIILRKAIPTFDNSTLYLLGISSATTIGATLIDINDQTTLNPATLGQNMPSNNFFLDILSDKNGVNVHRFQTVVFNIVFGIWFIVYVLDNLGNTKTGLNAVIPVITPNNLVLLGVSSGVYAALKITENQQPTGSPVPAAAPVSPVNPITAPVTVTPVSVVTPVTNPAGSSGGVSGGGVSGGITVDTVAPLGGGVSGESIVAAGNSTADQPQGV